MNALDLENAGRATGRGLAMRRPAFRIPQGPHAPENAPGGESLPGRAGGADGLEKGLPRPHRLCPGLTDPSEGMLNLKEILP